MKRFFELGVSARPLVWPLLGVWLVVVVFVGCFAAHFAALFAEGAVPMTVIDGGFVLHLLLGVAIQSVLWIVLCLLMLPVMKTTVGALVLDGAAFECDYDRKSYLCGVAWRSVLVTVTCGLYMPWLIGYLMNYFAAGVSHKFNLLSFRGKGMRLFAVWILTAVVPSCVVMLLVSMGAGEVAVGGLDYMSFAPLIVMFAVVAQFFFGALFMVLMIDWMVDMSYGDRLINLRVNTLRATGFVVWQLLLVTLTLGFYAPMASLRIMRYMAEACVVVGPEGEQTMGLRLRPWSDWLWLLGQGVLLLLTAGLYLPWYYARTMNRFTARLYIEER